MRPHSNIIILSNIFPERLIFLFGFLNKLLKKVGRNFVQFTRVTCVNPIQFILDFVHPCLIGIGNKEATVTNTEKTNAKRHYFGT